MFCLKCGTEIPENSVFCPNCGEKVKAEVSEIKNVNSESKKNNKKLVIIVITVIVLFAIIITAVVSIISSVSEREYQEEREKRLQEICIEAVQRISLDEIAWENGIYSDMSLQLGYAIDVIDSNAVYSCELSENGNPHVVTVELVYYTYEDDPSYYDIHRYTFLVETVEYEYDVLTTTTPYLEEVDSADFGYMSFDTYILEGIVDMYFNSLNSY